MIDPFVFGNGFSHPVVAGSKKASSEPSY